MAAVELYDVSYGWMLTVAVRIPTLGLLHCQGLLSLGQSSSLVCCTHTQLASHDL